MTHYDEEFVRERAVDIGGDWFVADLVLRKGDTAWNPCSTKGPLYGPSMVEYEMHRTGITVREDMALAPCMGGDRLDVWPYWRRCTARPVAGRTRCETHSLDNYVATT